MGSVSLAAHGFRDGLRWLSSVVDAGGSSPSDLLGWRRWRHAADARRGGAARMRAKQAGSAFLPEPVAVAPDRHHMAVVHQSIENRRCHHLIAEHLVPFLHWAVGADQHTALLVAAGDQLEEQVCRIGLQRQVAQLIDDQQLAFAVLTQPALQCRVVVGPGQGGDQLHRRDVLHRVALAHGLTAEGDRQMGLAHTGWAEQQQGVAIGDPPAGGQLPDLTWIEGRLGIELKALQGPDKRELGDAHRHRDAPLVLAGNFGLAQPGQRLPEIQLLAGRLLQQVVELIANRSQAQPAEHRLQLLHRHSGREG